MFLLYEQFWICDLNISVSSVAFAFEHGISESNKDSKRECRSVNDFRHNWTQWAAVKQVIRAEK